MLTSIGDLPGGIARLAFAVSFQILHAVAKLQRLAVRMVGYRIRRQVAIFRYCEAFSIARWLRPEEFAMEIQRSLGVSRLVALMAAHRGRVAHDRLLARLDRSVADARQLCESARHLHPDDPDGAMAAAFQTVLARPAQDWLHRAEAVVRTVRPGAGTICGARAADLRILIDCANVALMRPSAGGEAWTGFYRSALLLQRSAT